MGSPDPQEDADAGGSRPASRPRSPSARTVSPRRSASKHGVQLVDLRSGTVRTATGDLAGSPNWVLFSPDGKMVVSTNRDKTVTRWDVESATPLETLRGHSNFVQQPVFSPDGETLYTVSHDGTAIAWDLTGDRRLGRPFTFTHDRTFSTTGYDGHPGRLSPDGRLIAVGLKEQGVALWDARELDAGRGAPSRYGRRGQVARLLTGRANACSRDRRAACVTLWDVGSRSRLHEPLYAGTRLACSPSASARTERRSRRRAATSACNSGTWQPETALDAPRIRLGARATLPSAPTAR